MEKIYRFYDVCYKDTLYVRDYFIKYIRLLSREEIKEKFPLYNEIYEITLTENFDPNHLFRNCIYTTYDDILDFLVAHNK